MPAPLNLVGERYGTLTVLARVRGTPTRWLCRCDCGGEDTVAGPRLRAEPVDRRRITTCVACRSRRCAVCGATYLRAGSGQTCGTVSCRLIYRRSVNEEHRQRAEMRTPGINASRQRRRVAAMDPDARAALRESQRLHARLHRAGLTEDQRRAQRAAVSLEQRERQLAAMRRHTRRLRQQQALGQMMRDAQALLRRKGTSHV